MHACSDATLQRESWFALCFLGSLDDSAEWICFMVCLEWTEIHGAKVPRADLVLFNLQLSQHFELKSHIH